MESPPTPLSIANKLRSATDIKPPCIQALADSGPQSTSAHFKRLGQVHLHQVPLFQQATVDGKGNAAVVEKHQLFSQLKKQLS